MRPLPLLLLALLGCGGSALPAQPTTLSTPPAQSSAAPKAARHRLLILTGEHALRNARWSGHRVVAHSDRELWVVDPAQTQTPRMLETPALIEKLVTTAESPVFAVTLADQRVLVYDAGTLARELKLEERDEIESLSPDGRWMLVSNPMASDVRVYDAHTGAKISTFEIDGMTSVFDPTGTFLLRSGSLVRVQDGAILKSWHGPDAVAMSTQAWVRGRGVVFEATGIRLVDPETKTTKLVRYECKSESALDFVDESRGAVLHQCGNRAMFIDAQTGTVTRVKMPVKAGFFSESAYASADVHARATGTILVRGREYGSHESMTELEIALDLENEKATVVDREVFDESIAGPTLEHRSCERRIGKALAEQDFCDAEPDGAFWLSSYGGSFAIATRDGELFRLGAGESRRRGQLRLHGGAALSGVEEMPEEGETHSSSRWSFGAPPSEDSSTHVSRMHFPPTDRWCSPAVQLPNGNLLAACVDLAKGKKRTKESISNLVELTPAYESVAERAMPGHVDVVLVGDHPVTWDVRRGLPFHATEWAGLPSVCGESCAAVATYSIFRDFAVRTDASGSMQIAGTPDPNAMRCVDERGGVHPYEACRGGE